MPTVLKPLVTLCLFISPAIAADLMKDPRQAFACQKDGGVLSLYSPYGRAPTMSERAQCTRLGGEIIRPTRPKRPTPKRR